MKGTIRDSWNVWRRKVDEALGGDLHIDADDVIFDNTGTGITATDVEGAIKEVAETVGTQGEAISGLTETVGTQGEAITGLGGDIEALEQALDNEVATRAILGVHNLLKITSDTNNDLYGVSFVVDKEAGTVTVSGTNDGTGDSNFWLTASNLGFENLNEEIILDGCPSDGSSTTFLMAAYAYDGVNSKTDTGSGSDAFTVTSSSFRVLITVKKDYAITGSLVFKPQLYLKKDAYAGHQPYAMTNRELTVAATPIEITPTWSANIEVYDNAHFYKVGNVLYAFFQIGVKTDAITANTWYTVAELPSSVRPKAQSRGAVISSDYNSIQLLFAANGTVQIYSNNELAVGKQIIGCSFTIL